MIQLLEATEYAPYSKALMPYAEWITKGAVYLCVHDRALRRSPLQDLVVLASALAPVGIEALLSPAAMEAVLTGVPHFGTLRIK